MKTTSWLTGLMAGCMLASCNPATDGDQSNSGKILNSDSHYNAIRADTCSGYWIHKGDRNLLLGGSSEDNLFQVDDVAQELDLLKSAGGNYIRCTMSSRDSGNLWPFMKNEDGLYDLRNTNEAYWDRFSKLLEEAEKRDIIVQVEVWATFDFYRENWDVNPFNPRNNVNYDARRSKLPVVVETHPTFAENNFFRSVPSKLANAPVLTFQQQFVDELLNISLQHTNVLYCMDNETSVTSDWGKFWADYITRKAEEAGREVYVTEMWDAHDLGHPYHAETFNNPQLFNFVDISQNNHQSGDMHWNNGLRQLQKLRRKKDMRPVNNVKVYGNDGGKHKTTRDGVENFVQNVLMGCASARFHRPTSGQGINETAQAVITSMRSLVERTDFYNGKATLEPFRERTVGEQYCRCVPGKEYTLFFTRGGKATLDLSGMKGPATISWLNLLESSWSEPIELKPGAAVALETPSDAYWIAVIMKK